MGTRAEHWIHWIQGEQEARPKERPDMPPSAAEPEEEVRILCPAWKENIKYVQSLVVQLHEHKRPGESTLEYIAKYCLPLHSWECHRSRYREDKEKIYFKIKYFLKKERWVHLDESLVIVLSSEYKDQKTWSLPPKSSESSSSEGSLFFPTLIWIKPGNRKCLFGSNPSLFYF